jgi:hypothetical protein
MMKKINEGGIEGLDFSIQILGPEILLYRTIDKIVEISLGYDLGKKIVYIYASEVNSLNLSLPRKRIAVPLKAKKCF